MKLKLALCALIVSAGIIGVAGFPRLHAVTNQTDDAFTLIVLPDTQIYAQDYPEIFLEQTRWIVDNADELNIRMVLHAGDVVHQGALFETQWENAKAAMDLLDRSGIPTIIAIGNHDYDDQARTRASEKFNEYFGVQRYADVEWFGGAFEEDRVENVYGMVEVGGRSYLFMTLEFGPRKEAIDWANDVISSYPDHDVIVITHSYMYFDNTHHGAGDLWNPKDYGLGADAHDGDELWELLFRRHGNVRLVLSGHVLGTGVGRRIDVSDHGNLVHQVLANYQMRSSGGQGYLRIMRFFPSEGFIDVRTYSPYLDRYLDDDDQSFQLVYDASDFRHDIVTVKGRMLSALDGSGIANEMFHITRMDGSFFGAEGTDEDGGFELRLPRGTFTIQTSAEGFRPIEQRLTTDGLGEDSQPTEQPLTTDETEDDNMLIVEVPAIPQTYADIRIEDKRSDNGWIDWFSGSVELTIDVGPMQLLKDVNVQLRPVVSGEVGEGKVLYDGPTAPDPVLIQTEDLNEGTYEVTVETVAFDGMVTETAARFGVRNWELLIDPLLPPVQDTWLGPLSRKKTADESDGWVYVAGSSEVFFGDEDRLGRAGPEREWLVWEARNLYDFEVDLYVKDISMKDAYVENTSIQDPTTLEGLILIDVSSDGDHWEQLVFEETVIATSDQEWSKWIVSGEVPSDAQSQWFRLTLVPGGGDHEEIQIGEIRLRSFLGAR